MHRRKWCAICREPIYPTVVVPDAPDYWMRLAGEEWVASTLEPEEGEVATQVSYRCNPCRKTFRLVIPGPVAPEA